MAPTPPGGAVASSLVAAPCRQQAERALPTAPHRDTHGANGAPPHARNDSTRQRGGGGAWRRTRDALAGPHREVLDGLAASTRGAPQAFMDSIVDGGPKGRTRAFVHNLRLEGGCTGARA